MKKATITVAFDTSDEKNHNVVEQVTNYAKALPGVKAVKVEANDNNKSRGDDNDAA